MKQKKIFLSSTYSDLIEHRKQIWNALEKMDVQILGMEKFGARKEDSLTTCLLEVTKCDIFILVVAMRFGSIDKKYQKSYTWLEYEKAKDLNKNILVYLIDEKLGEIKVSDFDIENYHKLSDFKEILMENHTIDTFISVEELVNKIILAIKDKEKKDTKEIIRPKKLESYIFRYNVDKNKFVVLMSLLNCKPFEFFSCAIDFDNGILLPRSIEKGYLVESWEMNITEKRYDFQYINNRGYKTTIEGIDYCSKIIETGVYNNIITTLIKEKVDYKTILKTIKSMTDDNKTVIGWKKAVSKILETYK